MKVLTEETACRGCEACLLACSLLHENESNPALARLRVEKEMAQYTFHLAFCLQCENAPCVLACPSEAIFQDIDHVVRINQDDCIVCGICAEVCPQKAIFYNERSGHYFKCDVCSGLPIPACVTICPVGALSIEEVKQ